MNKWLVGNGHWCPACQGSGRGKPLDSFEYESGAVCQFYAKCESCNGERRLPGPGADQPVAHTVLSQLIEWQPGEPGLGPHRRMR